MRQKTMPQVVRQTLLARPHESMLLTAHEPGTPIVVRSARMGRRARMTGPNALITNIDFNTFHEML